MTLRVLWLCVFLCGLSQLYGGGGKEAFRNYFMGSYYFAEGDYGRAENHLRRAYQLDSEEYYFALAYALVSGKQQKNEQATTLLQRSKSLLPAEHPDVVHLRSLFYFVSGMVHCYGKQFGKAQTSLKRAARLQESLNYPEERSIMYNALGYAQIMNQGKGSGAHGGLEEHYHVHRRDMERAFLDFKTAYQADVQNTFAQENYQMLLDTLGYTSEVIQEDRTKTSEEIIVGSNYEHLPANMRPLLDFVAYDEVVLLLDISGSMVMEQVTCIASDRFDVMKETALLLLEHFEDSTKVGIGTIGGDCGTVPRLWIPTDSLGRKDLWWALDFLVPDGTTPLLTILQETPNLFSQNRHSSKAIIFISDGENICRMPGVDICDWSESLSSEITINIMTFLGTSLDNSSAFAEYTCLAENTFGKVLYLDGDRCKLEHYDFDFVKSCGLALPPLQRVKCWGASVKNLWAIFPEGD